jgi:hypothetical protein
MQAMNNPPDWRKASGMFGGDELMRKIVEGRRQIREA